MGLDMYLNKFPRYKDTTPDQISAISEYCDWSVRREKKEYISDSFVEWAGEATASELPDNVETIQHYFQFAHETGKYYRWWTVYENVAYWRKANAIHRWFVENIQSGEDDCCYHREVTKEDIVQLLEICKKIIEGSVLGLGEVRNGQTYTPETGWLDNIEEGKIILNAELAHGLLPAQDGFFFGSTDYDQWYMENIISTYNQLTKILEETDFEKEMLFYRSSW